jgi:vacuolar-type H+-ATPase subunit I/STV1
MLTAAWIGMGTIHLLVRRGQIAWGITAGLGIVSLAALGLIASAPIAAAASGYQTSVAVSAQYKDILVRTGTVTALTIILNIFGTLAVVGGAIYSAYLFWRKQVLLNRVIGNVLIAAGALAPAMAGSFVKTGLVDMLYISELIGAVLMFLGFLLATSRSAVAATSQAEVAR